MPSAVLLSKSDARRALVRHHFAFCDNAQIAFKKLRSIQFDPIAPVGCNHDLVIQARVPGYKIGDWETLAYRDRLIYDGWDKMASLVPFEGWPLRRIIYGIYRRMFDQKIFVDHREAVDLILKEITDRGPMMPRDFEFQQRREDWKDSWYGPSVTKQTLRALWHSGLVMTTDRRNGQHLYDLTERVVPPHLITQPLLEDSEARVALVEERHRAMGILRPGAASEVWSNQLLGYIKRDAISRLVCEGKLVPIEVEGVKAHSTQDFLSLLDLPSLDPRVVFIAPLDQFMWDRKMVAHIFGFDYIWEIYTPEAKRRWGYYVLPILYGETLVARVEFWNRRGVLEIRRWHSEPGDAGLGFRNALARALAEFMNYCSATELTCGAGIEANVRDLAKSVTPLAAERC